MKGVYEHAVGKLLNNSASTLQVIKKYKKEITLLWRLQRDAYTCQNKCPINACCECPKLLDCVSIREELNINVCTRNLCYKTICHLNEVITKNFLTSLPEKEVKEYYDTLVRKVFNSIKPSYP